MTRQHNGQKKNDKTTQWSKEKWQDNTMVKRKMINNDLQNITQKTEDRETRFQ